MNYVLLSVGTPSYAQKVKRLLGSIGIGSEIVKRINKGEGCTHAVQIQERFFYEAAALLREKGIPFSASTVKNDIL